MKEKDNKKINWKKIENDFINLVGEEVFKTWANPFSHSLDDKTRWHIFLSMRDSGKTTNVLLTCLLCYVRYGITTAYIRTDVSQITWSKLEKLFSVIHEFEYIDKMTKGKYNRVIYDHLKKQWYMAKVEPDKPILRDKQPCMYALAIREQQTYKSTFNVPTCDLLIVDEMVNDLNYSNEFQDLCHLQSTIFRHRLVNCRSFILSNTLTRFHFLFRDLMIQKHIKFMKEGEYKEIETDKGTHISVSLIKTGENKARKQVNSLYWGFDGLQSITGGNWDLKTYPHITREMETDTIDKNLFYIKYCGELITFDLINVILNDEEQEQCFFVHSATRIQPSKFIYSDEINIKSGLLCPLELFKNNILCSDEIKSCLLYQDNETGDLLDNIINFIKTK